MEPTGEYTLKEKLRARLKNCRLSRASVAVREDKLSKIKTDLDKILEPTGINADDFIKSMAKTGAPPKQ